MKPIIFARIADMKYYRGITENDKPKNGGSYVNKTGNAHECYNFQPEYLSGENKKVCFGFVMLTGGSSTHIPELHIENIIGAQAMKNDTEIEGVTVVWCAKSENGGMRVVGFYKNATVFRHMQEIDFLNENDEVCYTQCYNFIANAEDCVLLPYETRHSDRCWFIPMSARSGYDFGFGQCNVWYGNSKRASEKSNAFVEKIIKCIEEYNGENLMYEEEK